MKLPGLPEGLEWRIVEEEPFPGIDDTRPMIQIIGVDTSKRVSRWFNKPGLEEKVVFASAWIVRQNHEPLRHMDFPDLSAEVFRNLIRIDLYVNFFQKWEDVSEQDILDAADYALISLNLLRKQHERNT